MFSGRSRIGAILSVTLTQVTPAVQLTVTEALPSTFCVVLPNFSPE
jgi:hypothetical protein